MDVFDRIDPSQIDKRDAQLWVLAIAMMLIFSGGVALLAYPAAFSTPAVVSSHWLHRVFMSFCALSLLLVGYLIERQVMIQRLRSRLYEAQIRVGRILTQASAELLDTLPRFEHFQDRLAMEFRRAVSTKLSLSLVLVHLKFSAIVEGGAESATATGDAAKAMVRKLRSEDSLYLFSMGVFGILLPGLRGVDAHRVADRLAHGLREASGSRGRFSFEMRIVNYPEHVSFASEMEQVARAVAKAQELAA